MRDPLEKEKVQAIEVVKIGIPVLCEAVAVILFIAACAVWIIIRATPGVPV